MDLKINNINFQGKKEILYGLKKAASLTRTYELTNKAYVASRIGMTKYEEMTAYRSSIRAYFDMVTNDTDFSDVINNSMSKGDILVLKNLLKPQTTEHGRIEPLQKFIKEAVDIAQINRRGQEVLNALDKLAETLK